MITTNLYTHQFIAHCPNNGIPILYTLSIKTAGERIPVEDIVMATTCLREGLHEVIADVLFKRFGGHQTLRAFHHGVAIETVRDKG